MRAFDFACRAIIYARQSVGVISRRSLAVTLRQMSHGLFDGRFACITYDR